MYENDCIHPINTMFNYIEQIRWLVYISLKGFRKYKYFWLTSLKNWIYILFY